MRRKKLVRQSMRLLPGHEHLSVGDFFRSVDKSKLPKAPFALSMSMPTVAVIGRLLPLHLSLEHDTAVQQASHIPMPPTILLQNVKITIEKLTGITYTGGLDGSWGKDSDLKSVEYPKDSMPVAEIWT